VEVFEYAGAKLPKTLDEVDCYEVGTPLTFAHMLKSKDGAWYGLDANQERFEPRTYFLRLRPEVPEVPGLFLTGQDVTQNAFGPSALAGLLCAAKVLGRRNPFDLLDRKLCGSDSVTGSPTSKGKVTPAAK